MTDRTPDVALQVRELFDAKAAAWPSKYAPDGRLAGRLTRLTGAVDVSRPRGRQCAGPRLRHRRTGQRDRRGRNAGDRVRHLAQKCCAAPRQPTPPARSTGFSSIQAGRCCRSVPRHSTRWSPQASWNTSTIRQPCCANAAACCAQAASLLCTVPEPASSDPLAGVAASRGRPGAATSAPLVAAGLGWTVT